MHLQSFVTCVTLLALPVCGKWYRWRQKILICERNTYKCTCSIISKLQNNGPRRNGGGDFSVSPSYWGDSGIAYSSGVEYKIIRIRSIQNTLVRHIIVDCSGQLPRLLSMRLECWRRLWLAKSLQRERTEDRTHELCPDAGLVRVLPLLQDDQRYGIGALVSSFT